MTEILILAVGLAMDAVAVALVRGSVGEHRPWRAIEVGLFFGIAQGVMPLAGWALGTAFADQIAAIGHWVAFSLLALLGGRMIHEALMADDDAAGSKARSHYAGLAIAAVATSIDAAAAGIALPLLDAPVALSCLTIGGVTALLCAFAYVGGMRASERLGQWAELAGGVILIGLGTKILVEHLAR